MTDFFRESQHLTSQDQMLVQIYSETGCSVDSLAYTSEFEDMMGQLRAVGDLRSRSEILQRLKALKKAGKLPRLGARPLSYDTSGKAPSRPAHLAPDIPQGQVENKPTIGLNSDYRGERLDAPAFTYITAGYHDALYSAGSLPIILPPLGDERYVNDVLDLVDGLVLVGGADLDPRAGGQEMHPSVRVLDPRREKFDRLLVRLAAKRKLPLYGIGVGMQLLNVSQGGSLFLHIPEDIPKASAHLDPMDAMYRHGLEVEAGSLMARVYSEGQIQVTSMHHMAIKEVAPGFRATARSPDGVVEAIESGDPEWFAFGTQFHPETRAASLVDLRLFKELVAACRERAAQMGHAR